jgi:putative ABC transport system ATP-binding protein
VTTGDPVLVVRGLVKVFGSASKIDALRGLDLTVAAGEFVAVMGASGSGKSTLLHLLAGLDRPSAGSIRLAGVDLARLTEDERALLRRRRLGLIFQAFHLLETLSAVENVALPLAIAGRPAKESRRRAREALARVGLAHRLGHLPEQLSGGEQQRVAVARALVIEPAVLLADEPTGNLDSAQGESVMDLLAGLVRERGQTLLMVTHDPAHASRADRVLHLRDGRLVEENRTLENPSSSPGGGVAWTHLGPSALLVPEAPGPPPTVHFVRPGGRE